MDKLRRKILELSERLGFIDIKFINSLKSSKINKFEKWLEKKYNAQMKYLARENRIKIMENYELLLKDLKTIVVFAHPYSPPQIMQPKGGYISLYARSFDYHEEILNKLNIIADIIEKEGSNKCVAYCDDSPFSEKTLGAEAGIGFIGKNSLLINPIYGSFFFLGEIFTTAKFDSQKVPEFPNCGSCNLCIKECPTKAIKVGAQIDAGKCISYLTIEHKGSFDEELKDKIGDKIFGCDECQLVCPFNKDNPLLKEVNIHGEETLEVYLKFNEKKLEERFSKTPLKRIKFERFIRNVKNAVKNRK